MNQYSYKVIDNLGVTKKGTVEAKTKDDAVRVLQNADFKVISIDEKVALINSETLNSINIGGIPLKEKVIFMRQMATLLSAGISLSGALEILEQQILNSGFKKAVGNVAKRVSEGIPFSKSLETEEGVFDSITISLIRAGEESGKMEEILLKLAEELEKKQEFQGKVKSAMIYPIIMLIAIVGVVAVMMIFMVPKMVEMFAEFGAGELPFSTRIVVGISNFIIKYKFIILALVIGGGFGFRYYYNTDNGKKAFDRILLKIPIWGNFIQQVQVANYTRTMALLLKSGMDIVDILKLTSNVLSNYWFKKGLLDSAEEVSKGVPLALPISRVEFFPPLVSRMIAVGEETGKLEVVFEKMSEYYDREVKQMTENLSAMMEPIMLIVMGVIVGFIAFAVYGPMFEMSSVIGG
ncbi:MAG TPA: type II secretion system F family protein [Candidatus Dojkabacteria bacterium]|nr:type II secretion system F family protein [Candidatus Dojkabacteria bacterium]HQF37363.1 type II secretion system F family protein [Candidatus Dojkabacteria bacterium]